MTDSTCRIHWMSFTIHAPISTAHDLYNDLLKGHLGNLNEKGNGGRGFKEIFEGALEMKIYTAPIAFNGEYYHYEISGQACDALPQKTIYAIYDYLRGNYPKFNIKRLDLAIDSPGFTPGDFIAALKEDKVRSLTTRESLKIIESPFEKRDSGEKGTLTVYFGSPNSERNLVIYNKRGFTRLEFRVRGKRANAIASDLFSNLDYSSWGNTIISHLQDFIEIKTDWWKEFIGTTPRAHKIVTIPKDTSLDRTKKWLYDQVSPSLSTVNDACSEKEIEKIINSGREKRGPKYDSLLDPRGKTDEDDF